MKEIELKNGKRVGVLALVLFASVALAAIVLLLPAVQNIAIAFGEKILGRELRDYEKWYRVITRYGFFILAIECISAFFYWDIKWHYGKIVRNKMFNKLMTLNFLLILTIIFSITQSAETIAGTGNGAIDASVFKYVSFGMTKGLMPYRDAFDHKGPLIYIINYFGIKINHIHGVWFFELIAIFITFLTIYKIARIKYKKLVAYITVLVSTIPLFFFLHGGNMTEEFAMPFIAISLFIFIDYFFREKINCFRLMFCGFSFGTVCMLRLNMTAIWIVYCIAVLINCIRKNKIMDLGKFLFFFIIGFASITIPICMWLYLNGALNDFINCYIIFNLKYSSIGVSHISRIKNFIGFMKIDFIYISLIILVYLIYQKRNTPESFLYLAYLFAFVLSMCMMVMAGRGSSHYAMILIPLISYPIASLADSFINNIHGNKILCVVVAAFFLFENLIPTWGIALARTPTALSQITRKSDIGGTLKIVIDLITESTSENEKISVYGNWDAAYNFSKRLSASKYSYQFTIGRIDSKIMDEYFSDIEKKLPSIIVFTRWKWLIREIDIERMQFFLNEHDYKLLWKEDIEEEFTEVWIR